MNAYRRLILEKILSMKTSIPVLALLVLILSGCQNRSSKRIFLPEALLSQRVSFDITKDTIIKTKQGIIIRIPAGSLQSTGNTIVELEIKEATNVGDMIRAGIPTQTNGKPLASGGAIFINVIGEDQVRINKSISIAMPTQVIDDSMKLFKGELDDDSNLNWIDPRPMLENPQAKAMHYGKSLFINNCASCHAIDKRSSGPELAHIVKRSKPIPFGEEGYVQNGHNLLYDFTRNNQAVLKWSLYYRCLYNQHNKMPMNVFPDLTETDLNNIYSYIENESEVKKLPIPDNGIEKCLDSCLLYAEAKIRLKQMKSGLEGDSTLEAEENIILNASIKDTSQNKRIVVTRTRTNFLADLEIVDPIRKKPLYYQFNIDAFGWYNVEKLLEEDYGSKESLMLVRVKGAYNEKLNVYLVIPSMKVVAEGSILDAEKNTYGFYSKDGTVSLPQNTNAFVLAMQEMKDSVAFAKKEFITSNAQYFDLSLSKVRKSNFKQEINPPTPPVLKTQVKEISSTSALRRKLKDITDAEDLKPKNCDCRCFTIQPVNADSKSSAKELSSTKILPAAKDSSGVKVSGMVKDSVTTKTTLKAESKKQVTNSATKPVKKPTSSSKKSSTTPKKKKPVYKGRVAKK
jgi:mono/diheme cytochrome c family protein